VANRNDYANRLLRNLSDDNLGIFSTELQRVSLGLHEISLSLKNLFPTSIFPKAV